MPGASGRLNRASEDATRAGGWTHPEKGGPIRPPFSYLISIPATSPPNGRLPLMRWIPNALTLLRVLLLPLLIVALVTARTAPVGWVPRMGVVGLFLLMAVTDWLDGYLARRWHTTSRWGSMADAVADRLALLVPLTLVALLDPPVFAHVPLWIPLWLVTLDAATAAAWLVARRRTEARAPRTHTAPGQVGTGLLYLMVLWILVDLPEWGVVVLAVGGLILATASALLYMRRWRGVRGP